LSDAEYLSAMQLLTGPFSIPYSLPRLWVTVILLPLSAWFSYQGQPSRQFWCFLAAAIIYIVGTFGVTIWGNVPLNDALDKINIAGSSAEELARHRGLFEAKWNMLHSIRTIANIVSALLAILGCLSGSK